MNDKVYNGKPEVYGGVLETENLEKSFYLALIKWPLDALDPEQKPAIESLEKEFVQKSIPDGAIEENFHLKPI